MLRRLELIVAISFIFKQSWECVPLPYLDGEYSKISWFFFMFGVFCSRKQRFLSLFVCWGGGDVVSDCFWFVGRGETVFLDFRGVSWEEKHGFYSIFVVHEISIVP